MIKARKKIQGIEHAGENKSMKVSMIIQARFSKKLQQWRKVHLKL